MVPSPWIWTRFLPSVERSTPRVVPGETVSDASRLSSIPFFSMESAAATAAVSAKFTKRTMSFSPREDMEFTASGMT